jgi:hypothetical protein
MLVVRSIEAERGEHLMPVRYRKVDLAQAPRRLALHALDAHSRILK